MDIKPETFIENLVQEKKAAYRSQLAAGVDKDLANFTVPEPLQKFESLTHFTEKGFYYFGGLY